MEKVNLLIAICALIVALIGGVPGIIEVMKYLGSRAELKFQLQGSLHGDWVENGNILMVTGTLSNGSEESIIPAYFDLFILLDNKWRKLQRMSIPKDVKFSSNDQNIEFSDPWQSDLQNMKLVVNNSSPAYGHLLFISSKLTREDYFKISEYKLICVDVRDRKHEMKFSPEGSANFRAFPIESQKHGFKISPYELDSLK